VTLAYNCLYWRKYSYDMPHDVILHASHKWKRKSIAMARSALPITAFQPCQLGGFAVSPCQLATVLIERENGSFTPSIFGAELKTGTTGLVEKGERHSSAGYLTQARRNLGLWGS
jgi:hypothetical protein